MKECDSMDRFNDREHIISIWKKKSLLFYKRQKAIPKIIKLQYFIIISLLFFLLGTIFRGRYFCMWYENNKNELSMNKETIYEKDTKKESNEKELLNEKFSQELNKRGNNNQPMIAFSFDDGPNPKNTKRILNALNQYGYHATFFVIGTNAEMHIETLKAIAKSGSEIGNHTYDHLRLTDGNYDTIEEELEKVSKIVEKSIGKKPKLVRPPYGSYNKNLLNQLKQPVILWDIDTLDWKSKNTHMVVKKVLEEIEDGDIVLMHDIYDSTACAVEILVPELQRRGFRIVSVSELAKAKGVVLQSGKVYRKFEKMLK